MRVNDCLGHCLGLYLTQANQSATPMAAVEQRSIDQSKPGVYVAHFEDYKELERKDVKLSYKSLPWHCIEECKRRFGMHALLADELARLLTTKHEELGFVWCCVTLDQLQQHVRPGGYSEKRFLEPVVFGFPVPFRRRCTDAITNATWRVLRGCLHCATVRSRTGEPTQDKEAKHIVSSTKPENMLRCSNCFHAWFCPDHRQHALSGHVGCINDHDKQDQIITNRSKLVLACIEELQSRHDRCNNDILFSATLEVDSIAHPEPTGSSPALPPSPVAGDVEPRALFRTPEPKTKRKKAKSRHGKKLGRART